MSQVTIVTSPDCNYCHAAKALLQQKNIGYREVDLRLDGDRAQQLMVQSGQRTVPQIFINQIPIGGYTELSQLIRNNALDLNNSKLN